MKPIKTLLAIPVHNEASHLREVLAESRHYVRDILVVDDGSTDRSPEILAGQRDVSVIRHPANQGYGQSLADAFCYSIRHRFDWLITMDCDWQHEPSFIPKFMAAAAAGDADIVSGSRYLERFADNSMPPSDRQKINATITAKLNDLLGLGITDAFCGFKAHRVSALRKLNITVPGYAMPLQFWVQVWRAKLRIREIPIRLIYNDPNRHFGGNLDNPSERLRHYEDVLNAELEACEGAPREGRCVVESAQPGESGCCCRFG